MSGNIDANSLLIKLDRELSEPVSVVVCGGLVIEICYGGDGSRDVDALDRLSVDLKRAVEKIAEQTGNDPAWFNDHAVQFFSFDKSLPTGWRDRAYSEDPIFVGVNLILYPLARRDLILTKLFAVFSRGGWEILKDIFALSENIGASTIELNECIDDLEKMLKGTRWEKTKETIRQLIGENFK